MSQIIVVGGGLAGLSAAHTILERGGRVLVLDKSAFLGGNSTKATSGINGALTSTQVNHGVPDSRDIFYDDTAKSAGVGCRPAVVKQLTHGSAPGVEWLQENFNLDLSLVSRLGAHSHPRTHRGKEKFPGAAITMALMDAFDVLCDKEPHRAKLVCKARVTKLLQDASGTVTGCEYVDKEGATHTEHGPVILSTGGFGADFSDTSLLASIEHEWDKMAAWGDVPTAPGRLRHLPTTNGEHCTGDGIKMSTAIGAGTIDMEAVQVHPTGLIHPDDPDAKVRFLAAEALRGVGGIIVNKKGERFVDELQKRDHVTGRMWNDGSGVFPLILNSKAAKEIEWHCMHYGSRGLMKHYKTGAELAQGLGVDPDTLAKTFEAYNQNAEKNNCPYGKKYFHNLPFKMEDNFHVGMVGPVVHYTMGGVAANEHSEVIKGSGELIDGLFAAGEVMGGVHGKNRLGGNSLLDCVVFGRVSGARASRYQLSQVLAGKVASPAVGVAAAATGRPVTITIAQGGTKSTFSVTPGTNQMGVDVSWGAGGPPSISRGGGAPTRAATPAAPAATAAPAVPAKRKLQIFSREEVAKHITAEDCWVIIQHEGENKVYDVTKFLPDHPGGVKAPVLLAGKDATQEFNMLHDPKLLGKYGTPYHIGKVE